VDETQSQLPQLTINALFIRDFVAAKPPCFALGYLMERGIKRGFIAIRPAMPIPESASEKGFAFGHSVIAFGGKPILHFGFAFYGHATYHGLVIPDNPVVQTVLSTMLDTEDYFFFAINPDNHVTLFRSQLEYNDLAGLRSNQKLYSSEESCTPEQYEKGINVFRKETTPPEYVMEWVCRHNWDYLDLEKYPLPLTPQ